MPDIQEIIALLIVAGVAAVYIYRRRDRKAGTCGDCANAAPPKKESIIRFYRRRP
jgi:hypothetical protein